MNYDGEYWLTSQGDSIRAFGKGGHTGAVEFCILVDTLDSRLSAMRDHGWKRIEGLNVETWSLSQSDCDAIKNGLCSVYGNTVEYQYINLYVYGTKKYYVQLPLMDLKPQRVRKFEEQSCASSCHS